MAARLDPAVAQVRRAVRFACADLDPGRRVVVACSGGPDSTALAGAAVFESRSAGWLVGAAVVDHGLQPSSADVAGAAYRRLSELGCDPVEILRVSVAGPGGPEAAARRARYEVLSMAAARDDAVVLLGHTRDDLAETVLLGLARGSGTRSLAGMPPAWGRFRRPLLGVSRADARRACEAMGLTVWDDPHNTDPRFARARVRHTALPALERTLGPGVAEALARTAELARDDADALDAFADDLFAHALTDGGGLSVDVLARAPNALRRRVLRRRALAAGSTAGEMSAGRIEAVDELVTRWRGQKGVELPGRVTVRREGGELRFAAAGPRCEGGERRFASEGPRREEGEPRVSPGGPGVEVATGSPAPLWEADPRR